MVERKVMDKIKRKDYGKDLGRERTPRLTKKKIKMDHVTHFCGSWIKKGGKFSYGR
jgi:hypothetical protein